VNARVRAHLANKILDRAGHTTLIRKDDSAREKALSGMTREGLAAFIEKNQAEIDKVEGELAARMTGAGRHGFKTGQLRGTENIGADDTR